MGWNKRKIWKILSIIFIIIVLIVAGVNWYILSRLEKIIIKQLKDSVYSQSNGLYRLNIDNMHINMFDGYLSADGLTLYPDSGRIKHLMSVDSIPADYATINVNSIKFEGINFRKENHAKNRHLNFSLIKLESPYAIITHNTMGVSVPTDSTSDKKTLYEIISPFFDEINVKNIIIDKGRVEYYVESPKDTTLCTLENIRLNLDDFRVDSTSEILNKILYCENFQFQVDSARYQLPGKVFLVKTGKINLVSNDSSLFVNKIELDPQYPKYEFAHKSPNHSDWIALKIDNVACVKIDFRQLLYNKSIRMDSLQISNVSFENFKNQKINIEHHKMPLLHESFQRFKMPVDIKNVKVDNVSVIYEELAKNEKKPGMIKFTDIHGEFSGLTNIVSSHRQTNTLIAKGKLMGYGQINASFYFPVDSLNDRFEIIGTLGGMNMLALNQIIEPLAPAKIENGFIEGMDFHITASSQKAQINMMLLYKDLSISIFKEHETQKRTKMQLFTFLANGLVKKNNPDEGKEPRRVNTEWVRDPYHSSFNYLWKIYLSGIIETVGFTNKEQKQIKWIKDTFSKLTGKNKTKNKK